MYQYSQVYRAGYPDLCREFCMAGDSRTLPTPATSFPSRGCIMTHNRIFPQYLFLRHSLQGPGAVRDPSGKDRLLHAGTSLPAPGNCGTPGLCTCFSGTPGVRPYPAVFTTGIPSPCTCMHIRQNCISGHCLGAERTVRHQDLEPRSFTGFPGLPYGDTGNIKDLP
jgi:hypothetical protein